MDGYEFHPWEIWNGGECPCPGEMVQVQLRCDTRAIAESRPITRARVGPAWKNGDIIAFRRVKKPATMTRFFRADALTVCDSEMACEREHWATHRLIFEVVNGEPVNPRFERIAE